MTGARHRRRPRPRRGVTLIEVLAGLTLLGTLLASLVVANAEQARQAGRAADRLRAVAALDALLTGWHAEGAPLPPGPGGNLPPAPGAGGDRLVWSARRVRRAGAAALGCVVVRVEARRAGGPAGVGPLASAELLVTDEVGG